MRGFDAHLSQALTVLTFFDQIECAREALIPANELPMMKSRLIIIDQNVDTGASTTSTDTTKDRFLDGLRVLLVDRFCCRCSSDRTRLGWRCV